MKYLAKLTITLVLSILVGALIDGARAGTPVKYPAKKSHRIGKSKVGKKAVRKASYGGEALKPKTSLKFDGRSVEALRAGKYDSLSIGDDGAKGAKRLYDLPANFQARAADSESEMRYRQ